MATSKPKAKSRQKKPETPGGLPSRAAILDYIAKSEGAATRRDIARAFSVKGEARAELRDLLKAMEEDGALDRSGRSRFARRDILPPVSPVDIYAVSDDGDLYARPVTWPGESLAPIVMIPARKAAKTRPAPGVGDRLLVRLRPIDAKPRTKGDTAPSASYVGDIIKAIGKSASRMLAVFKRSRNGGAAEPVDRRARDAYHIDKADQGGAKDGDLVWIEPKNQRGYGAKKARITGVEGHADDPGVYSLISLAAYGIPVAFPGDALKEADAVRAPSLDKREDMRALSLLTIDPGDAKDHDDAVWAAPDDASDNEDGFKLIVAIADVSWFVRPGSALDREARKRGNSTYLPDRVVPMLPEVLSNGLCSLRVDEDRPCLAVEMTLTATGAKKKHRFFRAMMRSGAKLAYEDAQQIINGKPPAKTPGDIVAVVRCLHGAYRARLKERAKRAPLDLELPERKIVIGKNGLVDKVVTRERFDAHKLIEEFMILANVAAAETLERRRTALIYRVHDEPDAEKLAATRDYLDTLDYTLSKGAVRPANFNQILKKAEARDEKEMVSDVILRAQRQAVYSPDNLGHFGLNLARYAHFTSPIRRYADLIVHRALVTACGLGAGGQSEAEKSALSEIAQSISDLERRSMAAERDASDRFLSDFLAGRIGAEFEARIRGVTRFGLFVMLEETGADGFVPMRTLGSERFRFEEAQNAVVGERSGARFFLGQAVTVRLAEATPLQGGLRFDMISEPHQGAPAKSGPRKNAPPRKKSHKKLSKKSGKRKLEKSNKTRSGKRSNKPRR